MIPAMVRTALESNAFTGVQLDRAADGRRRDDAWVAAQEADPHARALLAGTAGIAVSDGRLSYLPLASAPPGVDPPVLLGVDGDGPLFAVDEGPPVPHAMRPPLIGGQDRHGDGVAVGERRVRLRQAAAVLPQDEGGIVAYAAGVLNWHRRHRFCSVCGAAAVPREGGYVRHCDRCGTDHHPRLDPVVIMLVTDGDRVLLGRQRSWPTNRYSALAGFVSQGESLEEAVAREVGEEAGVEVGQPKYIGSQPWPFPSSLMLGFIVPWIAGEPPGTDPELEDVRWFKREELKLPAAQDPGWEDDRVADVKPLLPPRSAIARRLVEHWLEG